MTVQKNLVKNIYVGNGSTTQFPITFDVNTEHPEYIHVYLTNDDNITTETENFTVNLTAKTVTYPKEGQPLATGKKLVIMRELPLQQLLDLINQGDFFADDIEQAFDDLTMITQQLSEKLARAMVFSVEVADFDNIIPLAPGMSFRINDDGTGLELTEDPAKVLPQAQNLLEQTTQQANIATEQAGIATSKANAAAESALAAATSETNAGAHEDKAQAWAESETSPDGEPDSKSAKTWAEEAISSAAAAAESESNAAASATAAAGSASAAAQSQTNAAQSATSASQSASAANSSQTAAANSASAALTSENNAAESEQNAAGSASAAANSASAASQSATAAAQSAEEAAQAAAGIGNPVANVTESNGTVTVEKSDGTTNSFKAGINMLGRNKTYAYGDIAYSSNLPSWAYLYCVQAGTTAASEPSFSGVNTMGQYITDGTAKWIVDDVRFNHPVGVVFYDSYLHAGCVKYNGATVQRSDYIRIAKIATDENLWTESPSTEPWKFGVGDGSTTMTLPDFRNRFIEGSDNAGLIAAGLPNITGKLALAGAPISDKTTRGEYPSKLQGCFSGLEDNTNNRHWSGAHTQNTYSNDAALFNASASNDIYGLSSTVQPPAITLLPQIKF